MAIFDQNSINLLKPTDSLQDDGFITDGLPISGNINYIFNKITAARIPVGIIMPFMGVEADIKNGWLFINSNSTIGSSASSATHANDEYLSIFSFFWNWTGIIISNGKGGSAASDFSMNKKLTMPNLEGTIPVGEGTKGPLYSTFGSDTHTLSEDELPNHSHISGQATVFTSGDNSWGTISLSPPIENLALFGAGPLHIGTSFSGDGAAHENMQPSFIVNYIVKW